MAHRIIEPADPHISNQRMVSCQGACSEDSYRQLPEHLGSSKRATRINLYNTVGKKTVLMFQCFRKIGLSKNEYIR